MGRRGAGDAGGAGKAAGRKRRREREAGGAEGDAKGEGREGKPQQRRVVRRRLQPEAEVVEFVDPTVAIRQRKAEEHLQRVMKGKQREEAQMDLSLSHAEIVALGATQLKGKAKREYEAQRIVALGGKAPKAQKMPYGMLIGVRKSQRQRAEYEHEQALQAGMPVRKRAAKQPKQPASGGRGKHWVDRSSIEDKRMRGGVLQVAVTKAGRRKAK